MASRRATSGRTNRALYWNDFWQSRATIKAGALVRACDADGKRLHLPHCDPSAGRDGVPHPAPILPPWHGYDAARCQSSRKCLP